MTEEQIAAHMALVDAYGLQANIGDHGSCMEARQAIEANLRSLVVAPPVPEPTTPRLCEQICAAIKAADDQTIEDAGYMLDSNDCIAIVRQEFARATTPRPASEPVAFIQDGFICRAWGESDHPAVAFVPDWEGVRQFMVREWLGDDDATDYDGENTLDRLKRDFAEHETDQRDGVYEIEFEIGGVSIERVRGFTATPQPAAKPRPQPLYPERADWTIAEGYRLHKYKQGTNVCVAFHQGIRFAEQHHGITAQEPT
jgi:hypothetical protein